jgi:hypothetical protein
MARRPREPLKITVRLPRLKVAGHRPSAADPQQSRLLHSRALVTVRQFSPRLRLRRMRTESGRMVPTSHTDQMSAAIATTPATIAHDARRCAR